MKNILIILTLAISTLANAIPPTQGRTGAKESIPDNSIYQSCGHSLYEQDSLISTEAYLSAGLQEQEDMLEAHFNKKRQWCYGKEFSKVSVTLVPSIYLFYKAYMRINGNNNNPAMGMGGAFMMYGIMGSVFGSVVNDALNYLKGKVDSAKSLGINIFYPSGSDPMEKYELRYVRQKPHIDKTLQEILEENFINARTNEESSAFGYGGADRQKKSPIEFAKAVLALPTTKAKVVYDPARIEKHLGSFDPAILSQFKRFAVRHAAASTGNNVKKIVAYFQGPPGVGKTLAAGRIAETLQVPFEVIKLADVSVEKLLGSASEPGLLLEAMLRAKYNGRGAKNLIIFLDEIDRALGMTPSGDDEKPYSARKSFGRGGSQDWYGSSASSVNSNLLTTLLTLLEPGEKDFYNPFLGVKVDYSSVGFIAAGNFDITDSALSSRFETINFTGYTPQFKKQVVKSRIFSELLEQHKTSDLPLIEQDFDKSDWERINSMIDSDKDLGFRSVITKVENYMSDKVLCKYYQDCPEEWINPPKAIHQVFGKCELSEASWFNQSCQIPNS